MKMQEIEFNYQQKLDIAKWIAKMNHGAITGSIMLRERGIELGREPADIDIIVEDGTYADDIVLPPLCADKEMKRDKNGYEVLKRCYFFGLKIEFISDSVELKNSEILNWSKYNEGKFATVNGLLNAKKKYIENDIHKPYIEKTKRDIEIIQDYIKQHSYGI